MSNVIDVICAWCSKKIGEKQADNLKPGSVTHGICDKCCAKALAEIEALPKPKEEGDKK